jgi:transcriptional regulator with XRE-family HTH domain
VSDASPTPAAIGLAVRAVREERGGMSRDELAHAANVSRVYLWGIETGERNPTVAVLARLAQALDIKLSELIARAERDY